jgi:hypothetical protein
MSGLTGVSTKGVGRDIVDYLREVADYFGVTIRVTSGYRDPDAQARAMFDNWSKMKHGRIYKKSTLPEADRAKLDEYWTAAQSSKSTAQEETKAETDFLELAKAKVGSKSMHSQGRAVDVARAHISQKVYRAITMHLHEVKEGSRTDIYHFESRTVVPKVDQAMRDSWRDLDSASCHPHKPPQPARGIWC